MRAFLVVLFFMTLSSNTFAASYDQCGIVYLNQSDTYSNFMLVKLDCTGNNLPSCPDVIQDTVVFDATTPVGKFRASMLLSAHMAKKKVSLASWDTCPAEIPNAPLLYAIIVH